MFKILFLLIMLYPVQASALAGLAERTSVYYYNDYALADRGHPSDMCPGEDKWCLKLSAPFDKEFKDIDTTFYTVNKPTDPGSPYVIGQLHADRSWVILDLDTVTNVFAGQYKSAALSAWQELGQPEPVFVDGRNTDQYLAETQASKQVRRQLELSIWLTFTLMPLSLFSVFCCLLSRQAYKKYKAENIKRFYYFTIAFLLPVPWFLYVIISSLVKIYI